jgi:hypothetical protein
MRSVADAERSDREMNEVQVVQSEVQELDQAVGEGLDSAEDEEPASVSYAGVGCR